MNKTITVVTFNIQTQFYLSTAFRLALGSTHPPVQWVQGPLSRLEGAAEA
jgi:hypothetical protein